MRIHFYFNSSETIQHTLVFNVDWNLPYFPRVGEEIGPSIVMDNVTPKQFYEALTHFAKESWNKQASCKTDDCTTEQDEKERMRDWLLEMNMRVEDVEWCLGKEGYFASIMLDEYDNILKRKNEEKCPYKL